MLKTKECKHGTFTYHTNDHWLGGALDVTGEYSPQEVDKLVSMIRPGDHVIEVGSNFGTITIPLARAVGDKGRVYAYEAQPQTYDLLLQNIVLNDLKEVIWSYSLAVSNKTGSISIGKIDYEKDGLNSGASSVVAGNDAGGEDLFRVPTTTLDRHFVPLPPHITRLIKIDVEGHEIEVLHGAEMLIARDHPILYVENDRPEHSRTLIRTIMEWGYKLYWHFPVLFNPAPEQDDMPYVSVNMLCLHESVDWPDHYLTDCFPIRSEHDDWQLALQRRNETRPPEKPHRSQLAAPNSKPGDANHWACVVRLGGVGDNIIASSVFPALKKKYGNLEVICAEPQHVVFENNPYIDKLTVKAQGDPDWGDGHTWMKYWQDRAKEYRFFANLSHSCESFRALLKVQSQYYWPASARRKFCGQSYLEAVADICEVDYADLAPGFYPTEMEIEHALDTKKLVGGRYISWVLSGTRIDKIWPQAPIVIARLIKELDIPILLFGAPGGRDHDQAKQIEQHVLTANGSLRGLHTCISVDPTRPNWPIRRVLTQTMHGDLVISPDTGPAWAVSQRPVPKIMLLSHASPENITKHWVNTTSLHANPSRVPCWPCHLLIDEPADCERHSGKKDGAGAACITDIQPDVVVEHIKRALFGDTISQLRLAAE